MAVNTTDILSPPAWYQNWWIVGILVFELSLLLLGAAGALAGHVWGAVIFFLACLMFIMGVKKHNDDPLTYGLISVWQNLIDPSKSESAVVKGMVPLLDFFPFYIGTDDIDMTTVNKDIDITNILSKNGVPLTGKVSVSLRPDKNDLIDFIASKKMDGIMAIIDDVITADTKKFCRTRTWESILQQSSDFELRLIEKIILKKREVAAQGRADGLQDVPPGRPETHEGQHQSRQARRENSDIPGMHRDGHGIEADPRGQVDQYQRGKRRRLEQSQLQSRETR
jgi:hypothetical protein